MNFNAYDCLDIGADTNSLKWARQYLGAKRPLGLNVEDRRLKNMQDAGEACVVMNAFDIPADVRFDYVMMSHLLEHLQSEEEARRLVTNAITWANKAVYISGPAFSEDDFVRKYGVKFVWGDWVDHLSRIDTRVFLPTAEQLTSNITVSLGFPIFSSDFEGLVSIDERPNVNGYTEGLSLKKETFELERPVFCEYLVVIKNDHTVDTKAIHRARHGHLGLAAYELVKSGSNDALHEAYRSINSV